MLRSNLFPSHLNWYYQNWMKMSLRLYAKTINALSLLWSANDKKKSNYLITKLKILISNSNKRLLNLANSYIENLRHKAQIVYK